MKIYDIYRWIGVDYKDERAMQYQFSVKAPSAYLAMNKAARELGLQSTVDLEANFIKNAD